METGWTFTKVNRCLAEGRRSFLARFAGIEAGEECQRWQTVLSAMVDGEASPDEVIEVRPHLRNCSSCRATLRGLHEAQRPLAAVLPAGLMGAGAKLGVILGRVLPGGAPDSPAAAVAGSAGGAGLLGLGGAKIAALVAAGVAATAGSGLVAVRDSTDHRRPVGTSSVVANGPPAIARSFGVNSAPGLTRPISDVQPARTRSEFVPASGTEIRPAAAGPTSGAARVEAPPPRPVEPLTPADTASGEFAPRP